MRKLLVLLLAMLCLMQVALPVYAGNSAILDSAGVLSPDTLRDADKLAAELKQASGLELFVEFRHFLGGADVQAAADKALHALPDSDNSLLLLAAVGEDSYALAAGKQAGRMINKDSRDNLLSTHFRLPFLARDYDMALAEYLRGAASQLTRGQGKAVSTQGLFVGLEATKRPDSEVYRSITIMDPDEHLEQPGAQRQRASQRDKGMSIFSIIAIGFVLSGLFGNKGKRRGCGCGPLGWIFGVFGVSKLFGWRK